MVILWYYTKRKITAISFSPFVIITHDSTQTVC